MESHSTWVEQREGKCILQDFGDRLDAPNRGTKVWFGKAQELRCAFYVASSALTGHRNAINAGGMVRGNDTPPLLHHGYSVAFFDSKENLIACEGGGRPESGTINSVTCRMPIPQDVHKRVDSYKVAYYESDRPIGETRQEAAFRIMCQGDGNPIEKVWPSWKSDGELRDSPYRVHAGSRLLPIATNENWQAETTEGTCSLRKITTPALARKKAECFHGRRRRRKSVSCGARREAQAKG